MIVTPKDNKELYYRLIAMWVVCEAFAGGILHAAKVPFAGMVVSGLAVSCIIFIAYFIPSKTNILKATVTVVVFKLMLSPYAPPTAYIAVFFQGVMGQILFRNQRYFRLSALVLSILALTESAVQRLLVLLIVYGKSFWLATDEYLNKLVGSGNTHYSLLLACIYISIHSVAGLVIGIYAVRLAKRTERSCEAHPELLIPKQLEDTMVATTPRKKFKVKWLFVMIWLTLIVVFFHAYADPTHAILPSGETLKILLRSLLIVLTWYLVLVPLIMRMVRAKMDAIKNEQHLPIKEIMYLLPGIKNIFMQSRSLSASQKGLGRLKLFLKMVTVNILTGRSGKV